MDSQNDETFGDVSVSHTGRTHTDINRGKSSGTQVSLKSLLTVLLNFCNCSLISIIPGIIIGILSIVVRSDSFLMLLPQSHFSLLIINTLDSDEGEGFPVH